MQNTKQNAAALALKVQPTKPTTGLDPKIQAAIDHMVIERRNAEIEKKAQQAAERAADFIRSQKIRAFDPAPIDTPIPTVYVVSRDYYLGYSPDQGALFVSKRWPHMLFSIQSTKPSRTFDEAHDPKFNWITQAEFEEIVKAKPPFEVLNKAYQLRPIPRAKSAIIDSTGTVAQADTIDRMGLATAKIVF